MSTATVESAPFTRQDLAVPRILALGGTVGLIASFLLVLHDVVGTVGDPLLFSLVVGLTLLASSLLARVLEVTTALVIGGLLFVGGMGWHILTLDAELELLVVLSNNVELLTGETVLRIQQADVWALTVVPTPVFVTWFLALRHRYVGATVVGGGMLAYLVLTGDAGTTLTLFGVASAGIAIAFGEIEAAGWSGAADQAVVVITVMVLVPLLVTVVPGGAASPVTFLDSDESGTMEDSVVTPETTLDIVGEVNQSPEPRFTVTSEEPRLWRTGSYDRYTGDGWIRTSDPSPLADTSLDGPPGQSRELTQEIEPETALSVFPAAWQPVAVEEAMADETLVGSDGGVEFGRTLGQDETVEVISAVPDPDTEDLEEAGRDYPEEIRERYTQLPDSTPDRVGERTEQITQNADTPFETAVTIEQWLETNRGYSLDIERPEGDIADAFIFEMDAGYCTYFATAMVSMLRAEEIPARMAVGYSPGEPVGEDEYLVRGLNSHAWVEVYFPDVGWVEFDPTPSGPRQETEQAAVEGGTEGGGGIEGIEEDGSVATPDPVDGIGGNDIDSDDPNETDGDDLLQEQLEQQDVLGPDDAASAPEEDEDDGFGLALPSREQLAISVIAFVGLAAWARQAGFVETLTRRIAVRFQRRSDPETDVERAYERLLLILEERHRSRRTGETMRQYLDDIYAGEDARRLVELREQARYAESVDRTDADEAVELVKRIRQAG